MNAQVGQQLQQRAVEWLAYLPPSWILAVLLTSFNVFVFRIVLGRDGRTALYFFPWGIFGFALGNLLATWSGSVLPAFGDVRVIEASVCAWAALAVANLRPVEA